MGKIDTQTCRRVVRMWNGDLLASEIAQDTGLSCGQVYSVVMFSRVGFTEEAKTRYIKAPKDASPALITAAFIRYLGGSYKQAASILSSHGMPRTEGGLRTKLTQKTSPYLMRWSGGSAGYRYDSEGREVVLLGKVWDCLGEVLDKDLWLAVSGFKANG